MGVLLFILLGAFVAGFAVSGRWCKNVVAQIFVGIFLGIGFLCVLGGIAFAGCLVLIGSGSHH